jgi:hypothetical protein
VQKQFWENVEKAQKGNVQVGNGRQKVIVTKEPVCMIVD